MYQLIIKFNLPGIHKWPDAPKKYEYLSYYHRHQFYWTIYINPASLANQDNRQLEIIDEQSNIITILENYYRKFVKFCNIEILDFKDMSCEQIAKKTFDLLQDYTLYDNMIERVEVLEDNENGASYSR